MHVRWWGGGWLGQARGGTEAGTKAELARGPVQMGIMPDEPREAQDQLEVPELHNVAGKDFRMHAMNAHARRKVVGDRPSRRGTAVDQLNRNGLSMLEGLQLMLNKDGGVHEAIRRARVKQRLDRDGRLARNEEVDQQADVMARYEKSANTQ